MQSITPLRVDLLLDNRLEQPFFFFFYTLNQSHFLDSSCNRPHNRQRWHFILKMQPRPSPPASSSPLASHCPRGPIPSSSHTRHSLSPFTPGMMVWATSCGPHHMGHITWATERVFPDGVRQRPEYSGGLELPSKGMNCSLPGSSVHGIFQARVLEWLPLPS